MINKYLDFKRTMEKLPLPKYLQDEIRMAVGVEHDALGVSLIKLFLKYKNMNLFLIFKRT